MDVKKVAIELRALVNRSDLPEINNEYWCDSKDHLKTMLSMIIEGEVTGEKAHRWLGWVQGCICMGRGGTLKDLKNITEKYL